MSPQHPRENDFSARADALFEWLQQRRTDRGHAYLRGYRLSDPTIPDWAFTDDLSQVGAGLVANYASTARSDVLQPALRLGDFYLRAHMPGSPDGAFVELLGTWCISPWPVTVPVEHFSDIQLDQAADEAAACIKRTTELVGAAYARRTVRSLGAHRLVDCATG